MSKKDWILQTKEIRRSFNNATWIPLRASQNSTHGDIKKIGYIEDYFGCGTVAFPEEHMTLAESLSWSDIGIGCETTPYAYDDGYYKTVEEYQYNDKQPIGTHLVFSYTHPLTHKCEWIINPDLIMALKLVKEGDIWVSPLENFTPVIKEVLDDDNNHVLIEIKKEFLIDYLAARNLNLRVSYYRQRVENVESLENSPYKDLEDKNEEIDGGRFELLIRDLESVYGGTWASMRVWRTDIDNEEDAPVMGEESDENTAYEQGEGYIGGYPGVRVEGEFFKDEWIKHNGKSIRIRNDKNDNLPSFIIETDGQRVTSDKLNDESIGRWLWFRSSVINELLTYRGFSLSWYTQETGAINSSSGYRTHFGLNVADYITVYAYDIARLKPWEQHVWLGHNVVPDGKVSAELMLSQVNAKPANTYAPEVKLFELAQVLEQHFHEKYQLELFLHEVNKDEFFKNISRFASKDQPSLLRLAKELARFFSERLNKKALKQLSNHKLKNDLGSNKLFESILADKVGEDKARQMFGIIAGIYDMRNGDAHIAGSKITDAIKLAGIDDSQSYLRQGQQLIDNLARSIYFIIRRLFD
ncbi:hypothetical protein [Acinetobacter sp. WCHAc060007]|jgi:hypothetical protein|uniref:hypothetical protein n=2 Tax=unclassified Acinetobacter TaxID=196816 RepID=UPI000EA08BEA|nr:hypothetical protein [Acinetobacter sp. WCHAc060007]RKG37229.1 hypothetical protein D7V31_16825 [Acinetobacter sp. WCHAc060007]